MRRRPGLVAMAGLVILVVFYLGAIGGYPLQDPDEGRYAEIPREMLESGDWVTPRLNYIVYFEKPPLFYWLVAASFEAFGQTPGAARAVSALAGILTVVLIFLLGRSLFGRRAALLGAGVLATSPIFFVLAQALTIDMVLTACMTATLVCFHFAERADRKGGWIAAISVSAALGVLAKGPVALILPGLIALCHLLWRRDWTTLRALLRPLPIGLFASIVVPWFVLVARANPDFLEFFFVREHLQRFAANVGHPEGPFYYLPILLLGPLPWTAIAIVLGCSRQGRAAFAEIPGAGRWFLASWGALIIAFFTMASSKLATYILPALPPLALLLGSWLDRSLARARLADGLVVGLGRLMAACGSLALATAALAVPSSALLGEWFEGDPEDVRAIVNATLRTGLAFGLTGFGVLGLHRRGRVQAPVLLTMLVLGLGAGLFGAMQGRAVVKTSAELARAIRSEHREGDLVVLYKKLWQGMPFYLGQRVNMIRNFDELRHGVGIEPQREKYYWKDLAPLAREWNSGRRVFVLTNREMIPEIAQAVGDEPRLLGRDRRRVVVVNFPPGGDGEGGAVGLREGRGGGPAPPTGG